MQEGKVSHSKIPMKCPAQYQNPDESLKNLQFEDEKGVF